MENMRLKPVGGKGYNSMAYTLKVIAWAIWIAGVGIGLAVGVKLGKVSNVGSYFTSGYSESSSEFSWVAALIVWISMFIHGLFPMVFAEIITLLQRGNTIEYALNHEEPERVKQQSTTTKPVAKALETSVNSMKFALEYSDQELPFSLSYIMMYEDKHKNVSATLGINWAGVVTVQGILTDIEIFNSYEEVKTIENVLFTKFTRQGGTDKTLTSERTGDKLDKLLLDDIKSVNVVVKKYSYNDEVHTLGDEFSISHKHSGDSQTETVSTDAIDFLRTVGQMKSSAEIKAYVDELKDLGDSIVSNEVLEIVNTSTSVEKMYGNNYRTCMKKLAELFGYQYKQPEENKPETKPESVRKVPINSSSIQIPTVQGKAAREASVQSTYLESEFDAAPLYCSSCGKRIEEPEAIFCPSCGSMIER